MWIAVGLILVALSLILFLVIAVGGNQNKASPTHPTTSLSNQAERRITIVPHEPGASRAAPPPAQITLDGPEGPPGAPITVTAPPPQSTVTLTVQAPAPTSGGQQPVAAPSSASPSGGSSVALITAITALVAAVGGLLTALTGVIKAWRAKSATTD
jgi:hypothetical protein